MWARETVVGLVGNGGVIDYRDAPNASLRR
eukprot:SAG22_NODE_21640_length_255_cov_0.782051_1_plen_29_part_10